MPHALPRRALIGLLAAPIAASRVAFAQTSAPLPVVASFSILADLARAIGGARLAITTLLGPGQDMHGYQPRPSDVRSLAGARVFLVNGLGFEGWMDRLSHAASFRGPRIIASAGIRPRRGGHGADPHAWQDVAHVKTYVANIRDGLIGADPANAAAYAANATAYLAQLDRLEADMRAAWAPIPRAERRIVTSHDAFAYYGAAYGVDFLAPKGLAAGSEPTPRQLAALIGQIRAQKIRALFVESISDPRTLAQLARETGVRIGPAVFSDSLSGPDGPAGSYLAMMRHNTAAFVGNLSA